MSVQCEICLDIIDGIHETACKCDNLEAVANELTGGIDTWVKIPRTVIRLDDFGLLGDEVDLSEPFHDYPEKGEEEFD